MKIISGHGLVQEGAAQPFGLARRLKLAPGACACGVMSEPLPSDNQRKKWHREHKVHVAHAMTLVDPKLAEQAARRLAVFRHDRVLEDLPMVQKAECKAAGVLEVLQEVDPDHPAFGNGFISNFVMGPEED